MRLFVAVDVSDEIREQVMPVIRLLEKYRGIKAVEPENLHITLKFLGEVDEIKAEKVKERLSEVKFKPFTISFSGTGFFPNENYMRVIWIGVKGYEIRNLAHEVEKSLKGLGFKKDKEFVAHLTVGRVKRITPEERIKLLEELKKLSGEFGSMTVTEFRLKKSTLTPKGPIYEDVAVFGGIHD